MSTDLISGPILCLIDVFVPPFMRSKRKHVRISTLLPFSNFFNRTVKSAIDKTCTFECIYEKSNSTATLQIKFAKICYQIPYKNSNY